MSSASNVTSAPDPYREAARLVAARALADVRRLQDIAFHIVGIDTDEGQFLYALAERLNAHPAALPYGPETEGVKGWAAGSTPPSPVEENATGGAS